MSASDNKAKRVKFPVKGCLDAGVHYAEKNIVCASRQDRFINSAHYKGVFWNLNADDASTDHCLVQSILQAPNPAASMHHRPNDIISGEGRASMTSRLRLWNFL